MKFLVVVLIIAVIGANASYIPKHLTIIGKIDNQDLHDFSKIIGIETIYQEAHHDESIESVVIFPKPESSVKVQHIQAIAFYDSVSEPSELMIVDGGIGQNHVVLSLRSQPERSIDSFIRFYGKKE